MAYKWIRTNELVRRLADGAEIPKDAGNRDWRRFLEWVAAGNTPAPADPPPPPLDLSDINNVEKMFKALALVQLDDANALKAGTYVTKTPAEHRAAIMARYRGLP